MKTGVVVDFHYLWANFDFMHQALDELRLKFCALGVIPKLFKSIPERVGIYQLQWGIGHVGF